ncbi:MAG: PP2C family protein-serine/threonine phosphatase [Phenylobacterium sp.]|uniref:PP2C family protein-serine/threonine phosphatase n=1 Tax=Phenylobacterium sp. TaxID=1871053 RepID=UPI00391D15CF
MSQAAARRPLSFTTLARTRAGSGRDHNEDAYLARPQVGLWAVADGMGGHRAGEAASGAVVEALRQVRPQLSGYALLREMRERLVGANAVLRAQAAALGEGAVVGSTVVALAVHEDHYACVWAGDSRAYLQRGELLMRLTHDHSLVQELIDGGALDERDAGKARISNVITRAVGASDGLELGETHGDLRRGDILLLCSDGLTGLVPDVEIGETLAAFELQAAADRLLELVEARGGRDDATFLLVRAD